MVAKFYSKIDIKKMFFSVFFSCFVHVCLQCFYKVLKWLKIFPKIAIWVLKNAEFDADFESSENVAKKLMWKKLSTIKDRKIEFLTFITLCKRFWPVTFWVIFCTFLNGFQLNIEFPNRIFEEEKNSSISTYSIANFNPKSKETAQKNKNVHTCISAWTKKKFKK